MKYLFLLLFTGCASTVVYKDGLPVMRTQADATNLSFTSGDVTFHADRLNHSGPTVAFGKVVSGVIGAGGAAVTAVATGIKVP